MLSNDEIKGSDILAGFQVWQIPVIAGSCYLDYLAFGIVEDVRGRLWFACEVNSGVNGRVASPIHDLLHRVKLHKITNSCRREFRRLSERIRGTDWAGLDNREAEWLEIRNRLGELLSRKDLLKNKE